MENRSGRVAIAFAVLALMAGRADRATAGLITYTESCVIQGSLGQHGFDSLMTLRLTADTSGITQSANDAYHYSSRVTTATVTVDGLSATFLDPVYVFSGRNFAGFTDVPSFNPQGVTILDVSNPVFTNYDLSTPIGPITGPAGGFGGPFATTLGTLDVGIYDFNGTFTATAAAVPGPPSLALCGIAGSVGLAVDGARRKRAVA